MAICIGAVVRRIDGNKSVVMIVDIDFVIGTIKNSKVAIDKTEHKRYCNASK